MRTIQVRLRLPEAELLDASDDLQHLFEQDDEDGTLGPPFRQLLAALDDAITDAFFEQPTHRRKQTGSAPRVEQPQRR